MGTNFYIHNSDRQHIGKRSASGLYCWDCHQTLCQDGEAGIHTGKSEWYDKCPDCGAKYAPEPLDRSSAGVELGFAKQHSPHKGVTTVASFTWAIKPSSVLGIQTAIVVDEYDRHYSNKQFMDMLRDMCPIEFYHSIGTEFS